MDDHNRLRAIPSVEFMMSHLAELGIGADKPRPIVVRIVRDVLERERDAILSGRRHAEVPSEALRAVIIGIVENEVGRTGVGILVRVINATGVVVHTNLGRAPLSDRALAAVTELAGGYCNLEYDLRRGTRGRRDDLVRDALCELTGADDAMVVNNNAAAVMLALNTLASGREVIVSRGELIEIGGSFRLPDVFERSGARMVEVGTTNRTRLADFEEAIRSSTGALLSAHWSNYTISGFVERVALPELVALGERYGIPVIHDLGSGILGDPSAIGLSGEMSVNESVSAHPTVSTFSGDKILGGPQAGIAVGSASAIARMRSNPLTRALRPGKLTLSALQATLYSYLDGTAESEIPVLRAIGETVESLSSRAAEMAGVLSEAIAGRAEIRRVELESRVGGGAAPERVLPSWGVEIAPLTTLTAAELADRMLDRSPPVVARTHEDRVLLDLRTVARDDDGTVINAVLGAFGIE